MENPDKKKILIADDNKSVRDILECMLLAPGRMFLFAEDGISAMRIAGEEGPDLVILDVQMPGADGYEVCRTLRADENTSGIRILMLSGLGKSEDVLEGFKSGADDYLVKPVSAGLLGARVNKLLNLKAVSEEEKRRDAVRPEEP